MSKTIATSVIVVSVNEVSDDDIDSIMSTSEHDSFEAHTEDMESSVETIVARNLFGDADEIPILDVNTDVYDEWSEGDAEKRINR